MIHTITDLIIRPLRPTYNPNIDLGPTVFSIDNKYQGSRIDFKVTNRRNQVIECSFFHRTVEDSKKYPLILFCHGNTGNRTNSYGTVYSMLRSKVNVITFDFAGCGLSEGKHISLGYYEQDDIADVLDHAIKTFKFIDTNRIGIWGRCMGAVSAILFTSRTNCISLLVLDSPFPDLVSLLRDYMQRAKIIPKWAEDYIYEKVRKRVKKQGNFDIEDITPISKISKCRVPAFFIHGKKDKVIPSYLFKKIYDAYPAAKDLIELETSHNDPRPDSTYDKIAAFVKAKFFPPTVYGRFEPTPKQANSKTHPVVLFGSGIPSFDSLRFNENRSDANEEGIDLMQHALETIRTEKNDDNGSILDLNEDMIFKINGKSGKKETKSTWSSLNDESEEMTENPDGTKGVFIPASYKNKGELKNLHNNKLDKKIISEEEAEISEELLESGEITNKDYLEMSYIESAAKVTFDAFRKNKRSSASLKYPTT